MRKLLTLLILLSCCLGATAAEPVFRPEIFGAVKVKYEVSLWDGTSRFSVRNTRFGLRGSVSEQLKYLFQVDFSNDGRISVLDAYVSYSERWFELSLGQQLYKFSSDMGRGPNASMFANRSFIAKFLTTYRVSDLRDTGGDPRVSDSYAVFSSRDLGAMLTVSPPEMPLTVSLGAFSGSGANNPRWQSHVNLIARVDVGEPEGLGGAVSHYNGRMPDVYSLGDGAPAANVHVQRMRMWGAELRYAGPRFKVEGEWAQRRLRAEALHIMSAAHVQGYYRFPVTILGARYLAPTLRLDMIRDLEWDVAADVAARTFDAARVTVGANLGFAQRLIGAELRVNFEKYLPSGDYPSLKTDHLLHDRVTLEMVASF